MIREKRGRMERIEIAFVGLIIVLAIAGAVYAGGGEKGGSLEVAGFPSAYSNWTYRMNVTIDAGKVTENLNDFPLLVSLYSSGLKDYAQSDGDDILFTDAEGNKLSHEIELFNQTYNSTDAQLIAWVRVNLSSSGSNILWTYYNNSGAANQQNAEGVWDTNTKGVYHLNEISGTVYDSTSNNRDSTGSGGTPDYQQTGKIGRAINFNAASEEYINFGDVSDFDFTGNYTICTWFKTTQSAASVGVVGKITTSPFAGYSIQTNSGKARIWVGNQTGYYYPEGRTVNDNNWHYACLSRNSAIDNGNHTMYVDGTKDASTYAPGSIATTSGFYIGSWGNTAFDYTGLVDAVMLSSTGRSIAWMNASYQNQNNPAGFYSIGAVQDQSSTPSGDNLPSVSLDKPIAGYSNTTSVYVNLTFNASVSDDYELINCSLWHNATGTWHLNQTQMRTGTSNTTSFDLNDLTNVRFIWNIQCFDNASNYSFGSANRTAIIQFVDSAPRIELDKPIAGYSNTASVYVNLTFNASVSDESALVNCSLWHNATGTWHLNQTEEVSGMNNVTSFDLNDLTNVSFIWNIQCFDSGAQSNFSSANRTATIQFVNATNELDINFVNPTSANGTTTSNKTIVVNATIAGNQTLSKLIWNWNGTNYSIYNSSLVFMSNFDNLSAVGDSSSVIGDISPLGDNGTIYGGMVATSSGRFNGAYTFDGVDDYVRVGAVIPAGSSYTKVAWIKRRSGDIANNIISGHEAGSTAFWCPNVSAVQWGFKLSAGHGGTWNQVQDPVPIEADRWYFVAVTYNSATTALKLYKNGVLINSTASATSPGASTYNYIGSFGGNNLFNGTIDEPRIYNRALSESEIIQIYMSNLQKVNATRWNLYINQSKNATAGLENGTYNYQIFAIGSLGNTSSSEQRTVNIGQEGEAGSGGVNFSEFGENPISNLVYSPGQVYYFNATILGSNGTAWLEFNGINYSASNESNFFNSTIPGMAAGYYSYKWYAYSNESGNVSYSESINYVVTRLSSTVNLTLNGSEGNVTITEGESTIINCSMVIPNFGTMSLYKESEIINSGESPLENLTTFDDGGIFEIACTYAGNENYSEASETFWVNAADTDDDAPVISFGIPSPVDGYNTTNRNIIISNKMQEESSFGRFIFSWNSTNYTIYDSHLKFGTSLDSIPSLGDNLTRFVDLSEYGNDGACYSTACPNISLTSRFNRVDDNTNNLGIMDRFNGDLSNWALDEYVGQISIVTKDYSKKMILNDTSAVSYISAIREFEEPAMNYLVEYDMLYSAGTVGIVQLLDSSDNIIVSIDGGTAANTINFSTDLSSGSAATFSAGVYKQIVISVDKNSNIIKVYISEEDNTYGSLQQVGSAKSYSGAEISKIKLRTGDSQIGAIYFDELRIYKPVLAVIGDSISDGKFYWSTHPAYPSGRLSSSSNENSPPNQKILDRICYNCWVANRAFGGSTTTTVNNKIQTALFDHNFSQLYISIGHNDINGGASIDTMKSNWNAIISKAQAMGINGTNIIIGNVFPSSALLSAEKIAKRAQWNEWTYNRSIELGAVYADLDLALRDSSNPNSIKSGLSPDGVHLYSWGNDILGEAVAEAISNANVYHNFKSFLFDGVNDYVNLGNDSELNMGEELSVSAWIKFNTSQTGTSIVAKGGSYRLGIENSKIVGQITTGGQSLRVVSSEVYNDSEWHNFIVSYNGSLLKLYADGALDSSNSSLSGRIDGSISNLTIGAENGSAMFFRGFIDDIRVLNRTFSDAEAGIFKMSDFRRVNGTDYTFYINKTGLADGSYSYQSFATDSIGNCGESELRTINVDATPPESVSNLANISRGQTWIYWNWTNPSSDFSVAIVYLNGTNVANTTNNYYNATGLNANETYTLMIYTKDSIGNVNDSNVSSSVTTEIDVATPSVLSTSPSNGQALSAGTTSTTIALTTNEIAECRYAIVDSNWSSMTSMSSTNSTAHSLLVSGLSNGGSYHYYFLCSDLSRNLMNSSYSLQFSVASVSTPSGGGGGGGGGGGATIVISNGTITISNISGALYADLELGGINNIIANPGEIKKIELSAKSSGTSYLNKCKIKGKGDYASWTSSEETKDLSAGQKQEFIFSIKLPENLSDGSYPIEVSLKCEEIEESIRFNVEIIKKKMEIKLIDSKKDKRGDLNVKYSINELAGQEQEVEIEIVLLNMRGERVAKIADKRVINPKSTNDFEASLKLPAKYDSNLQIIINAHSSIGSAFVEEYILLDNAKISGFASMSLISDPEKREKLLIWGFVLTFVVFALFITRRIMRHRGVHKKAPVISSMINQIIHGKHYHNSSDEPRIIKVA